MTRIELYFILTLPKSNFLDPHWFRLGRNAKANDAIGCGNGSSVADVVFKACLMFRHNDPCLSSRVCDEKMIVFPAFFTATLKWLNFTLWSNEKVSKNSHIHFKMRQLCKNDGVNFVQSSEDTFTRLC